MSPPLRLYSLPFSKHHLFPFSCISFSFAPFWNIIFLPLKYNFPTFEIFFACLLKSPFPTFKQVHFPRVASNWPRGWPLLRWLSRVCQSCVSVCCSDCGGNHRWKSISTWQVLGLKRPLNSTSSHSSNTTHSSKYPRWKPLMTTTTPQIPHQIIK